MLLRFYFIYFIKLLRGGGDLLSLTSELLPFSAAILQRSLSAVDRLMLVPPLVLRLF